MVATPIGNLADMGLRALHVLSLVDCVACEDTRHTAQLLKHWGLHKPLLALHQHNEAEAAQGVVQRLMAGQRVAYVSDAGTPGISDPGARLVAALVSAGLRTLPVPGASSLTCLLSASGLVGGDGRFVFAGFLSPKATQRQREVSDLGLEPRTCVLFEAPHRIGDLLRDLAVLGQRLVTLGRELTKQHEDIVTLPAADLAAWLAGDPHRSRGEFVLVLHPLAPAADDGLAPEALRTLRLLMAELPLKTAVRLCAEITGAPRNRLYALGLAEKQGEDVPETEPSDHRAGPSADRRDG